MPDASTLFDLAAKISVDSQQADKTIDSQQKKVQALAKEYEKLDRSVQASSKSVGKSVQSNINDPLDKFTAEFKGKVASLKSDLDGLRGTISAQGAESAALAESVVGLTALSGVIAATAGANLLLHRTMIELSVSTAKQSAEITKQAKAYGVSAETIQAANIVAAQTGEALSEVLKDQHGTLDATAAKLLATGQIMSKDMVAAGQQLNRELVLLDARWQTLQASLGATIIPHVTNLIEDFTGTIDRNRGAIDLLIGSVGLLASFLGSNLVRAMGDVSAAITILQFQFPALFALINSFRSQTSGQKGSDGLKLLTEAGAAWRAQNATLPVWGRSTGGGGRGGGGGSARTDPGVTLLKQLEEQFKNLTPRTELQKVQDKLLEEQYKKTTDAIKNRIEKTATEIDLQKRILAVTRERLVVTRQRFAVEVDERRSIRDRIALIDTLLEREARLATRERVVGGSVLRDLGGGSVVFRGDASRPRVATVEGQVTRERLQEQLERARALAGDLTSVVRDSLRKGFEEGMVAGLRSFAQGILDMIQSAALKALEARLTEVFTKVLSGGSGTSWWERLLGIGIAGAAGGIGGFGGGSVGGAGSSAAGAIGTFAEGGYMSPHSWGIVGERGAELIRAGNQGATITPNHALGGNITVNVYAQDVRSFMSRDTQSQIARQLTRVQQKVALAG